MHCGALSCAAVLITGTVIHSQHNIYAAPAPRAVSEDISHEALRLVHMRALRAAHISHLMLSYQVRVRHSHRQSTILLCVVLYCTVLLNVVLNCAPLYYNATLYCSILQYIVLHFTVLQYVAARYTVLSCAAFGACPASERRNTACQGRRHNR